MPTNEEWWETGAKLAEAKAEADAEADAEDKAEDKAGGLGAYEAAGQMGYGGTSDMDEAMDKGKGMSEEEEPWKYDPNKSGAENAGDAWEDLSEEEKKKAEDALDEIDKSIDEAVAQGKKDIQEALEKVRDDLVNGTKQTVKKAFKEATDFLDDVGNFLYSPVKKAGTIIENAGKLFKAGWNMWDRILNPPKPEEETTREKELRLSLEKKQETQDLFKRLAEDRGYTYEYDPSVIMRQDFEREYPTVYEDANRNPQMEAFHSPEATAKREVEENAELARIAEEKEFYESEPEKLKRLKKLWGTSREWSNDALNQLWKELDGKLSAQWGIEANWDRFDTPVSLTLTKVGLKEGSITLDLTKMLPKVDGVMHFLGLGGNNKTRLWKNPTFDNGVPVDDEGFTIEGLGTEKSRKHNLINYNEDGTFKEYQTDANGKIKTSTNTLAMDFFLQNGYIPLLGDPNKKHYNREMYNPNPANQQFNINSILVGPYSGDWHPWSRDKLPDGTYELSKKDEEDTTIRSSTYITEEGGNEGYFNKIKREEKEYELFQQQFGDVPGQLVSKASLAGERDFNLGYDWGSEITSAEMIEGQLQGTTYNQRLADELEGKSDSQQSYLNWIWEKLKEDDKLMSNPTISKLIKNKDVEGLKQLHEQYESSNSSTTRKIFSSNHGSLINGRSLSGAGGGISSLTSDLKKDFKEKFGKDFTDIDEGGFGLEGHTEKLKKATDEITAYQTINPLSDTYGYENIGDRREKYIKGKPTDLDYLLRDEKLGTYWTAANEDKLKEKYGFQPKDKEDFASIFKELMEEGFTKGSEKEYGTYHINGVLQEGGTNSNNGTIGIGGISTSLWKGYIQNGRKIKNDRRTKTTFKKEDVGNYKDENGNVIGLEELFELGQYGKEVNMEKIQEWFEANSDLMDLPIDWENIPKNAAGEWDERSFRTLIMGLGNNETTAQLLNQTGFSESNPDFKFDKDIPEITTYQTLNPTSKDYPYLTAEEATMRREDPEGFEEYWENKIATPESEEAQRIADEKKEREEEEAKVASQARQDKEEAELARIAEEERLAKEREEAPGGTELTSSVDEDDYEEEEEEEEEPLADPDPDVVYKGEEFEEVEEHEGAVQEGLEHEEDEEGEEKVQLADPDPDTPEDDVREEQKEIEEHEDAVQEGLEGEDEEYEEVEEVSAVQEGLEHEEDEEGEEGEESSLTSSGPAIEEVDETIFPSSVKPPVLKEPELTGSGPDIEQVDEPEVLEAEDVEDEKEVVVEEPEKDAEEVTESIEDTTLKEEPTPTPTPPVPAPAPTVPAPAPTVLEDKELIKEASPLESPNIIDPKENLEEVSKPEEKKEEVPYQDPRGINIPTIPTVGDFLKKKEDKDKGFTRQTGITLDPLRNIASLQNMPSQTTDQPDVNNNTIKDIAGTTAKKTGSVLTDDQINKKKKDEEEDTNIVAEG